MDLTPQIQTAVDVTLALRKEFTKKKSFLHDDSKVFLQVTLLKTPIADGQRRGFVHLAHSLAGSNGDVCLFVKNAWPNDHIARTPDEKIEFSIDHYKQILNKHKVKGVSAIMPLRQLRSEYGNYELKRKLANRFDIFLSELGLLRSGKFTSSLGKFFTKYHKYPIGVKFPKAGQYDRRFAYRIERALKTVFFDIRNHSDNYSIPVGQTNLTKEQLIENVSLVIKQLSEKEKIPGGFQNIKSIYLKTERSKPVPIYFSLESKNNVPVPHVKSKTPNIDPVEDELSTKLGTRVIVYPNGEVVIKRTDGKEDSDFEMSDFESDEDEEEEENETDSDEENRVINMEKRKFEEVNEEASESEGEGNFVRAPKKMKKNQEMSKGKKGKNVNKVEKKVAVEKKVNKRTSLKGKEKKPKKLVKKNYVEVRKGKVGKSKKIKA